ALGETDLLLHRTGKSTLPDDELAGFPVETGMAAALAHQPAAVIVSNPTAYHLDVAIPAAEAGCHILLEKPVSHNLDGVDRLKEAAARTGARVLVGFQFRWHPGIQTIKRLLDAGEIGAPVSARAHWGEYLPDWHPWEDYRSGYAARPDLGGGAVLTLSHPIDYLRMLLGEVAAVSGVTSRKGLGLAVEDTAEIILEFETGALGSVHLDYIQRPPAHWLEIIGTEGMVKWDQADGGVAIYRAEKAEWEKHPVTAGFVRNTMFLDEMQHFLAVTQGREQPVCTLGDGVRALEICLQVLNGFNRSSRSADP
ncbi:MAG TPA: Gfo/Idh/MocA family oxidoreductase, partial [Anaerolineales bacterium]|nr:Gfo/Idh/MocA family oxidoreductase [Anaerolineales bacterium]